MPKWELLSIIAVCSTLLIAVAPAVGGDDANLKKILMFHASFDENLKPSVGKGTLSTRFNHPSEAGKYVVEEGFDGKVFRIAKGKGVAGGGCLEATDVLPKNGRIFFPAKGNLAYKKGGWGGSHSVWINTGSEHHFSN